VFGPTLRPLPLLQVDRTAHREPSSDRFPDFLRGPDLRRLDDMAGRAL
jgi:hypothetical protein